MQCPNCHNEVPEVANVCGYCGYRLKQVPPAAIPTRPKPDSNTSPPPPPVPVVSPPTAPRTTGKNRRGRPSWLWGIGAGCGVLILFMVAVVVVPLARPNRTTAPIPLNIATTSEKTTLAGTPTLTPQVTPKVEVKTTTGLPSSLLGVEDILDDAQVFDSDDFNVLKNEDWEISEKGVETAPGGMLRIKGASGFTTYIQHRLPYNRGQAVQISFIVGTEKQELEIYFDRGQWHMSSYRRFGISLLPEPSVNAWQSSSFLGGPDIGKGFILEMGNQYELLLALDPNGEFLVRVWGSNSPEMFVQYRDIPGQDWLYDGWSFAFHSNNGITYLDNYEGLNFTGYR
jgi:hypothetical protein